MLVSIQFSLCYSSFFPPLVPFREVLCGFFFCFLVICFHHYTFLICSCRWALSGFFSPSFIAIFWFATHNSCCDLLFKYMKFTLKSSKKNFFFLYSFHFQFPVHVDFLFCVFHWVSIDSFEFNDACINPKMIFVFVNTFQLFSTMERARKNISRSFLHFSCSFRFIHRFFPLHFLQFFPLFFYTQPRCSTERSRIIK